MPKNHFRENRKKVQKAFVTVDFLTPLTNENVPYSIIEKNIKKGEGKLRVVNIQNIPFTDNIRPVSYVIDSEFNNNIFGNTDNQKKVEKIFLVFSTQSVYVIMVEMKSSLKPTTIMHISDKIRDSISKISLFLPNYIFEQENFDKYVIKFHCLVFHNGNMLQKDIEADPEIKSQDLFKILNGNQTSLFVEEKLGGTYKVRVNFVQNNGGNTEEMNVDFADIFEKDNDFSHAIYSEKSLPEEI